LIVDKNLPSREIRIETIDKPIRRKEKEETSLSIAIEQTRPSDRASDKTGIDREYDEQLT